ncbi:MAG: hypothetical protein ACKVOO_02335 [Burkholderiaceae bacterium]
MNVHQLSVTYQPEHDRILVRVNTVQGEEFRFWMTRRLTLQLWPVLVEIGHRRLLAADVSLHPGAGQDPMLSDQALSMLAEFKKEKMLNETDFKTPFKPPTLWPMGVEPLLLTLVEVKAMPNLDCRLSLREELPGTKKTRGFQLRLVPELMQGFMHLYEAALVASGWRTADAPLTQMVPGNKVLDAFPIPKEKFYLN